MSVTADPPITPEPGHAGSAAPSAAGWGQRVAAALIDGLILLPTSVLGTVLVLVGAFGSLADDDGQTATSVSLVVAGLVLAWGPALAYPPIMTRYADGQTVGKKLLSIRVIRADETPITLGRAVWRESIVKFALIWTLGSALLFIPVVLDALWPLWDRDRRALHDLLAGTRVVTA